MKYILVILITTNLSFSQEWTKVDLSDFASVELPFLPEISYADGATSYVSGDDLGLYLVSIKNLGNNRLEESDLPEFYKGVVKGTLEASNGELLAKNEFRLNGISGMEILYLTDANSELPELKQKRIVVKNSNLITYEFWTFRENEQLALDSKNRFFNSFTILEREIDPEKNAYNKAYDFGYIAGKIIFYLIIISVIVGLVFLVIRLKRKMVSRKF